MLDGYSDHELVAICMHRAEKLEAIIAIHSTRLGPAMGGCRMHPYESLEEATSDALRLSSGMTQKNALAGIPFGGAKAVIIADPAADKSEELLTAFAGMVNRFHGDYVTAEDAGIDAADLAIIGNTTAHTRLQHGYPVGDPSPFTAWGVLNGIETALRHAGINGLSGELVSVEGLGKVGMELCRLLHARGARLVVSDTRDALTQQAASEFGAGMAPVGESHKVEASVYAPCAMGGTLNARTITEIRARVVAGAANNQLARPEDGDRLDQRNVLYCPDFVINAGGVLGTFATDRDAAPEAAYETAARVGENLRSVLDYAAKNGVSTSVAAQRLAASRLVDRP